MDEDDLQYKSRDWINGRGPNGRAVNRREYVKRLPEVEQVSYFHHAIETRNTLLKYPDLKRQPGYDELDADLKDISALMKQIFKL